MSDDQYAFYHPEFGPLCCATCQQPILKTDDWSWLDGRREDIEHDRCYAERFARQFPGAVTTSKETAHDDRV